MATEELKAEKLREVVAKYEQAPIHWVGSVQNHGALVVVDPQSRRITHASTHLEDFMDLPPSSVIGTSAETLFEDCNSLLDYVAKHQVAHSKVLSPSGQGKLQVTARPGSQLFVEFERLDEEALSPGVNFSLLSSQIEHLLEIDDLAIYPQNTVELVKSLTGFGRVKLYRFDHTWNGHVVAEAKDPHMSSYLGLCFPASDIPAQARRLYTQTPVRAIPDVYSPTYPLTPSCSHTSESPLDMSPSLLRAVSPVHLQYLRNMGVGASLSISILQEGRLWGLIVCHHHKPKPISPGVIHALQLISTLVSNQTRIQYALALSQKHAAIVAEISQIRTEGQDAFSRAPKKHLQKIAEQLNCDLVYTQVRGDVHPTGIPKIDAIVPDINEFLRKASPWGLFSTTNLSEHIPQSKTICAQVSGMIAIRIGHSWDNFVLFFRPEHVYEIQWAGYKETKQTNANALTPRRSFEMWTEDVKATSRPFEEEVLTSAEELQSVLIDLFLHKSSAELERSLSALQTRNEEMAEFAHHVSHDLQSPVGVIDGFIKRAAQATQSEDAEKTVHFLEHALRAGDRMRANIEDLIQISRVTNKEHLPHPPLSLRTIASGCINMIENLHSDLPPFEIQLMGNFGWTEVPRVRVEQAIENILSNAVKYGLSPSDRKIDVIGRTSNRFASIIFRDHGPGIPGPFIPHTFNQLGQLGSEHKSVFGVGLMHVRQIMLTYGGYILLQTPGAGEGIQFELRFPAARTQLEINTYRQHRRTETQLSYQQQ